MHRDTAKRPISLSRSPETIEDVDYVSLETCIDPPRFSASDVFDLRKTEDKQRRGPQGTTSLTTVNPESNHSGMHLHTLDNSTPLCRSSEAPCEGKMEYWVSVLHLKIMKLDDQRLKGCEKCLDIAGQKYKIRFAAEHNYSSMCTTAPLWCM